MNGVDRAQDRTPPAPTFAEFLRLWNRQQGLSTPALHSDIAAWLEARWSGGDRALLLLVFRDAGKSTLVGLFCAWLLARWPDLRVLVLAADHALAARMVRNVKRVIERHSLTRHLPPARRDQWAADRFTVDRCAELRDPSVLARGITANFTGSRADVVICDDVEVPNSCDTGAKRIDLRARLAEIDYVMVPGGTQLYVGTPHTYYSIYAAEARPEAGEERPFLAGFERLELPLLDGRGRSRWPQRFDAETIASLRRRSGPAKFASQMMLRPVNIVDCRLDPERLRRYDAEIEFREANGRASLCIAGVRMVSASCWWDPSYGSPTAGDASAVAALFSDAAGGYWLHRVAYLTHVPAAGAEGSEAVQMCRQVVALVRALHLPSVTVETNGLAKFLPGLLRQEFAKAEVAGAVVEAVSRVPKDRRILEAFDAVLAAGALHAHGSVWDTPFIAEMREWRAGGRCRDDGLDAVSGCLLAEPVRLSAGSPVRPTDWRPGGGTLRAAAEFDV